MYTDQLHDVYWMVLNCYCDCHGQNLIDPTVDKSLLLFLFTSITLILLLRSFSLLPPHAARTPAAERRCKRKIDMLLGVETDNERRDVDNLLSNAIAKLSAFLSLLLKAFEDKPYVPLPN